MADRTALKLLPRNVAAFRRGRPAARAAGMVNGNPVSTRLESAGGNCFPGLECDLRNLERRFFPFLEVDFVPVRMGNDTVNGIVVAGVDQAGVSAAETAGQLTAAQAQVYRQIAAAPPGSWRIVSLQGNFGPLGTQPVSIAALDETSAGAGRRPPDAWTAVRLLVEDTDVSLVLRRGTTQRSLTGRRRRYLNEAGALQDVFAPGELSQSLCSPWTHDFRDCGCFYWASNHPDIALPPRPSSAVDDPRFDRVTRWERRDRTTTPAPPDTANGPRAVQEIRHYEINRDWQALNFVLEGREVADGRYEPGQVTVAPLPDAAALERHLRYAAGVELRIVHLYLSAAFSLRNRATVPANVRDDVEASRAEIMRIAVSEMLHLRWVNDVLRARAPAGPFEPALRVASQLPAATGGSVVATESPADPQTIDRFIDLERPSISVDGLYSRILATLQNEEQRQSIRAIMAEGEDHYRTFRFIREWLGRHEPAAYLRPNLTRAPAAHPLHQGLQAQYVALLGRLRQGYSQSRLVGAPDVNASRDAMLGVGGIEGAAQQVADAGFLVVFDPPAAPFAPVDPPA